MKATLSVAGAVIIIALLIHAPTEQVRITEPTMTYTVEFLCRADVMIKTSSVSSTEFVPLSELSEYTANQICMGYPTGFV